MWPERESGGQQIDDLHIRNIHVTQVCHLDRVGQSESVVGVLHQGSQVFRHVNTWLLGKHHRCGVVFAGFRWIAVVVRSGSVPLSDKSVVLRVPDKSVAEA